jgi:hypothetical protein
MGDALQHVMLQPPSLAPSAAARHHTTARSMVDAPLPLMQSARVLQPQLVVGEADDPFEREADRVAGSVTGTPGSGMATIAGGVVQRATGKGDGEDPLKKGQKDDETERKRVQKQASSPGEAHAVPNHLEAQLQSASGGQPLDVATRMFFEPRFGYDFSGVRTHTDAQAAGAAVSLGARAFTVGEHIYFGAGEFQPTSASGRRLIAHELTHTIQQQPAAARATRVQRDFFPDPKAAVLAKIGEWANELPPYELLTVLLGKDPITDKPVERNARNFLHAALKLHPNGMAIFDDLEKNKTIEKVSQWFDAEVTKLNLTWEGIKALFQQAWDSIGLSDVVDPGKAWAKVKAIFAPPLQRLADFAANVAAKIIDSIKKAVLDKLSAWAKSQKGYTLLTFVLGKDPVTGEVVERTPTLFVKAVLALVPGGDKLFENLQKSKTIEKTVAWLDAEITKLDLSWEKIKELFQKAWDAFSISICLLH